MPLVVIRFNQRSVYYEQQLYNAVSRAVEIKPSVRFELVSYMPHTGNPDADQRLANQATTNLQRVANSFIEMGVPRQRLTITSEPRRNMRYDEVHVFVQ